MPDTQKDTVKGRPVLTTNALFDGGGEGGGFYESIIELIHNLESKTIPVGTAIGVDQKDHNGLT